jgi:hypothetical protein
LQANHNTKELAMNRRLTGLAIVALLALCIPVAVMLRNAGAASAIDNPTTISLSATPGGRTTTVDVGRKDRGHGVGDYSVTTGAPLRAATSHALVGHLDVVETILSARASEFRGSVRLGKATIELAGLRNPRVPTGVLAVTGGTADYSNARGTADLKINERSGAATLTLTLLP